MLVIAIDIGVAQIDLQAAVFDEAFGVRLSVSHGMGGGQDAQSEHADTLFHLIVLVGRFIARCGKYPESNCVSHD